MYAETKRSYENVIKPEKTRTTTISTILQRKLRIQKDRLITWGLDWSDASVAQPADIDDALDRAGLSDIVASVMSSIQELLDEAEQMRLSQQPNSPHKRSTGKSLEDSTSGIRRLDKARFEDILKDLTMSIDTLFDLSRSRRGFSQPVQNYSTSTKAEFGQPAELLAPGMLGAPTVKVERPNWLSFQAGQGHRSSVQVDFEGFVDSSCMTTEAEKPNSLPPPYEDVPRLPASTVNLGTLLQLSADPLGATVPNLEDRLRLAFNFASNLNQFHRKGLAHGSINSKAVFFFRWNVPTDGDYSHIWRGYDVRNGNLHSGDHLCSSSAAETHDVYSTSIYHHPLIGQANSLAYRQACDSYSLGLVLLEIGFWMPLQSFWKTKYTRHIFKSRLENVYVKKLAAKCGSLFMRTVQYCLTAADHLLSTQSFITINTSTLQNDFCTKVIRPLERCCILDDPYVPTSAGITVLSLTPETEPSKASTAALSPDLTAKRQIKQSCATKRKLKIWPVLPPKSVLDDWNNLLLPCLDRILNKTVTDPKESFSADLMMIGDISETARPTVVITCTSVREIRTAVNRHLKYNRQVYDIRVRKGAINRSKGSRYRRQHGPGRSTWSSNSETSNGQLPTTNPAYEQQPACGASIGAFRDNEHLPPVSLGGILLLDEEPYGMTVHHMLEQFSDEEDYSSDADDGGLTWSSAASRANPILSDTNPVHSSFAKEFVHSQYPFEISDDEDDGYSSAADEDDEREGSWPLEDSDNDERIESEDDNISLGDSPGIDPHDEDCVNYMITQPAIDDVETDFFPNEYDRDEEHLASHFLGNVHASSGIRRRRRDGMKHEVDWALIKFSDHRLQHHNVVKGGRHYCTKRDSTSFGGEDLYPHQIAAMDELGGLKVHCLGRTSGLQGGTISPAMSLVKFQGRYSSSLSWHVVGNFGGKSQSPLA